MGLPLNTVFDVQKVQRRKSSLCIKCGWVLFVCFLLQTLLGSFAASPILQRCYFKSRFDAVTQSPIYGSISAAWEPDIKDKKQM